MRNLLLIIPISLILSCTSTVRFDLEPFVVSEVIDSDGDGICNYESRERSIAIRCACVYQLGDTIKLNRQ
jgi:hypothetical protein